MATSSRARYVSVLANTLNSSGKITSDNVLLPDSGVTAGSYGSASQVPVLTVDSKGRVTSASVTSVAGVTAYSYNTSSGRMTINTADGGSFTADVTLAPFSTTNLTEGTNQYFTTARARSSISSTGTNLSYNSTTGVLSYTQGNTDTVAEGATNLYYTDARARDALSYTTGSASYNSISGQFTIPSTTAHIAEGANLYYTDARVRAAISGGTGVTYNSATGSFSIGQPVATTDNVNFATVTTSGDVVVGGNLTVSGTTTTVNSTTVSVADINIEVARNATTAAQANGAGLTVTGPTTPATLTYSSADDRWNLNKDLNINRVYGNLTGAVTGNASTATTLETTRSITATGDASWTVNFNGSANVSGALTLSNSGVTAGSYGSGTAIPVLTIDSKGRVTSASTAGVVIGDGVLTVSAGAGLTGSGTFTANQTTNNTITLSHADTSTVANLSTDNAGNTFIQDLSLTFDTYGHVTGATVATGTVSVGDGAMTVTAGSGLTGGGQLGTANQTGASSVTISHADTSSVSNLSSDNSGNTVIQDISLTFDTYGHVTGASVSTANINTVDHTYYGIIQDTRAAQYTPNDYTDYRTTWEFTNQIPIQGGDWMSAMTLQGWHNGYSAWQIIGPASTGAHENWYLRSGVNTSWNTARKIWHDGNLTNLNQLTNGPGYITGESDTLATVTARGASTSTSVTLSSTGNHYSGHFYYDAYDAAGNYYPHLLSGSDGTGAKVNWRIGTGLGTYDVHYWDKNQSTFFNSVRSPIFYDSNDTTYYIDPAGNGTRAAYLNGNLWINPKSESYGEGIAFLMPSQGTWGGLRWTRSTSNFTGAWAFGYFGNETNNDIGFHNGTNGWRLDHSFNMTSIGSVRSPIFYDTDNTGYYVDPNSTGTSLRLAGYGYFGLGIDGDGVVINHDQIWTPSGNFHIQYSGGGNIDMCNGGGYAWSRTSFRSPVFYDSDDTSYYIDQAGQSRIHNLIIQGDWGNYGAPWNGQLTIRGGYPSVQFRSSTSNSVWLRHMDGSGEIQHYYAGDGIDSNNWSIKHTMYKDGTFYSAASMRSPIFYDANDTGYYVDPNSTSRFAKIVQDQRYDATNIGTYGGYYGSGDWQSLTNTEGQLNVVQVNNITGGSYSNYPSGVYTYGSVLSWRTANHSFQLYAAHTGSLAYKTQWNNDNYSGWLYPVVYGRNEAASSVYGTIFYDANDTGYYLNPNSWSQLSHGNFNASPSGRTLSLGGDQTDRVYNDSARSSLVINASYYPHLYLNAVSDSGNTTHGPVLSMTSILTAGGYRRWGMGIANRNPNELSFGWYDNDSNPHYGVGINWSYPASMWIDTGHNLYARGSMRAPIFYDYNDTGWYTDPASTSRMRNIDVCSGSYTASYYDAAIEVREYNMEGAGDDTWQRAPRIGFHWGGRVASSIAMSSNGWINIMNNPGTGFEAFRASDIYATGIVTAGYSDERLKTKVGKIQNALESVKAIETFKYIHNDIAKENGFSGDDVQVGVSAQSVEKVLPEIVKHAPFDMQSLDGKIVSKSGEWYKTVDYEKLTPLLIEAIKEQDDKISRLEALVETLINKLGEK